MSNGLLPTEEQLDEFLSTENSEELSEVKETPKTEEEKVTLSQEEYDELKKGQMLQSDYTRKRQQDSRRVKELEDRLAMMEETQNYVNTSSEELEDDLDESDLPDSVKRRVQEIDKIKVELEQSKEMERKARVKRQADEMIESMEKLETEIPALKSKSVKYSVMSYASNILGDTSYEGFKKAASEIAGAFQDVERAKQVETANLAKQQRASSPSIGSGGSAPMRTVEAPTTFAEANELVMDALGKMNSLN